MKQNQALLFIWCLAIAASIQATHTPDHHYEQVRLRPDQALNQAILQSPSEKSQFLNIQTKAYSSAQQGRDADSALNRIVQKRKSVESFEQRYKDEFSGKAKNAMAMLRKELINAENKLKNSLNTVEGLLTTADKKLTSTLKLHHASVEEIKQRHNATCTTLAYEEPVISPLN